MARVGRAAAVILAPFVLAVASSSPGRTSAGSSVGAPVPVVDLSSADFDAKVGDGTQGSWFVKFYAPWCGHCRQMAPVWDKLAVRLEGAVRVARVDCTKERWLGDQWDIEGFPTLKLIAEGHVYTYGGPRKLEALEAWARDGWRFTEPEPLPKDRPFVDRTIKNVFGFAWSYGVPVAAVSSVALLVWMLWPVKLTEEEVIRRKAFEERLAAYERKADQHSRHAAKAAGAGPATAATQAAAREEPSTAQPDGDGGGDHKDAQAAAQEDAADPSAAQPDCDGGGAHKDAQEKKTD